MKRLSQICLLFALSVAGGSLAHAQSTVPNGDLEINCGANAGTCPTFAPGCVPGWSLSHGTPQLGTANGIVGPSEFVLWNLISGGTSTGEGVYATLTTPTPTRGSYELCFYYRLISGTGNVVARFTTGLTPAPGIGCGEPIPTPATQLVAYNGAAVAGGWQHVVVNVSSLSAFTQLNVYPVANTTTALWIELDGFEVRHCGTSLVATPTTLPNPSGFYARSGSILATSSSSPGTVTANPAVNTTFRSGISVTLEPDFVAMPNAGIFFLAEIGPCGCAPVAARMANGAPSPLRAGVDYDPEEVQRAALAPPVLQLWPNPTAAEVHLQCSAPLAEVRIFDLAGHLLRVQSCDAAAHTLRLDTDGLPAGTYLVQAHTQAGTRLTQKLVKQ